ICLYEAIKQGRVERGDYILIWTMGYGDQYVVSLFHY
ncbi:MAG TPA: beta-ketoacyl-ACP synthase, partial [Lachnospiraceae bacterium]|nr:beta-ketoacyl-ACP synthase [Lachnospiraceae bacterium]